MVSVFKIETVKLKEPGMVYLGKKYINLMRKCVTSIVTDSSERLKPLFFLTTK